MTILHIFRSKPTEETMALARVWRDKGRNIEFRLYEPNPDYDRLVTLMFEADRVFTWF